MSDTPRPIAEYVRRDFGTFFELFAMQAAARPDHIAIYCNDRSVTYRELDALADRVASGLQRDGVVSGGVAAICASSSIEYAAIFIGVLRAGAAISPLSPSSTPRQLEAMLADNGASHLFLDAGVSTLLAGELDRLSAAVVALEAGADGPPFAEWLPPEGAKPSPVTVSADQAFNIIYSSGTTGDPKGIVQPYRMRWGHNGLSDPPGYGPDGVAIISTPLYSNTTLVSFIPALAGGGTVVLMPRFDARTFLVLSEKYRVTHAMLVPVQYRRILQVPDFDSFDLSSYRLKFATSAPFSGDLKAEVLRRWPGGLIEYYGMTEGGGSCMLVAHEHPDKLDTVGRPMEGHDIRLIDTDGRELGPGQVGEVVGRSAAMMNGYHNKPGQTAEATWTSPEGHRFIRTGDLASVDEDGFFTLIGRRKDMIISGGINIYPVDLEEVLLTHPAVQEAAVIGVHSDEWGETPVGFVTLHPGAEADGAVLRAFTNERLGKMQRLSDVRVIDTLPRSAIGKVLKRELQAAWNGEHAR